MSDKDFSLQELKRRLRIELSRFVGNKAVDTIVSSTIDLPYPSVNNWLSEKKPNPPTLFFITRLWKYYPGIDWHFVFLDERKPSGTGAEMIPMYGLEPSDVVSTYSKLVKCMEENADLRKQLGAQ